MSRPGDRLSASARTQTIECQTILVSVFDPLERARKKQMLRDADDRDMVSGKVAADELRRVNAFVPAAMARRAVILDWKEMDSPRMTIPIPHNEDVSIALG